MRSSRIWLIVAAVLLITGAVLVANPSHDDSPGWFAVAPGSASIGFQSFYLLTTAQVLGWAAGWLASLIVTGLVVRRFVQRSLRNDDQPD